MKFSAVLLVTLALVGLATCYPVFDFEGEDQSHEQNGEAGEAVEGYYSWTSPEGEEFYVKYVADELGYRVVESNAVPEDGNGVKADGNQGAFSEEEEGEEERK
ncbi:uncharacterized protein LOC123506233 [Portunus trituberculatus]|uniref:uncharacterized protein LOC123506233 n=1 Tax=Portunus trituberculatus TaxID=210409 RepID=UPI001E1D0376|nr:uncharacterized protein LOC123506233 [Portunus trituberculatus]